MIVALTPKQEMFVKEYLIDLNATQAAIRAGYSERTANRIGPQLLVKTCILEALKAAQEERSQRTEITADMVLKQWWNIATADPNDIVHLRRLCCRHCYGKEYQYQWKDEEEYSGAVEFAVKEAERKGEEGIIPSNAGGYGFNKLLRPNAGCPKCNGEGYGEVHVEDTRYLSPKAKLLYAGIKQTQAGIEIKMRDQDKALDNVARHLGMFVDKHEVTGKDGGPIETTIKPDLSKLTTEELRQLAELSNKAAGESG